jgi:hypothetical protein
MREDVAPKITPQVRIVNGYAKGFFFGVLFTSILYSVAQFITLMWV